MRFSLPADKAVSGSIEHAQAAAFNPDEHPVAGIDIQRLHDIARQRCRNVRGVAIGPEINAIRSEDHTTELQTLMRISYAVYCLKKTTNKQAASDTPYDNSEHGTVS